MPTVYRVNASEIDGAFLDKIKATFGNKEIEIVISELNEEDETEYLLKSSANKQRLLAAVENIKAHKNLVQVNLEDL